MFTNIKEELFAEKMIYQLMIKQLKKDGATKGDAFGYVAKELNGIKNKATNYFSNPLHGSLEQRQALLDTFKDHLADLSKDLRMFVSTLYRDIQKVEL